MERLDKELAAAIADGIPAHGAARVLLIGCEAAVRDAITPWLAERDEVHCTSSSRKDARKHLAAGAWDVMLITASVSESATLALLDAHQRNTPHGRSIVLDTDGSADAVINALRSGASDYIKLPATGTDLISQVEQALVKALVDRHRDERLLRLKKICGELNDARHEVSRQVDVLCKDLVTAYQELSEQMGEVAMATEFRTLMRQELDVEELLRTMLEYLLTKTGPTNAAVFLPDTDGHYSLGAYVNYDCPRDSVAVLLDHLCEVICPTLADEPDIISFEDADEFCAWIGDEAEFLADSRVIAYSCRNEDDCMAVVVLYRNASTPFEPSLAAAIDTLRTIFAEQLKRVIRIHHRALPQWPVDADDKYDLSEFDDDYDDLDLAA